MEVSEGVEIESQNNTEVASVYNVIVGNIEESEDFDNSGTYNLVESETGIDVDCKPNSAAIIAATLSAPDEPFFHWDKTSIRMLIEFYKEHVDLFNSPNVKKKKAWKVIANGLMEKGLDVSFQQCESKWKNLQRNYRKVKSDMHSVGTTTSRWPYFKEIDEINSMRTGEASNNQTLGSKSQLDDVSEMVEMHGAAYGIAAAAAASSSSSANFLENTNRSSNGVNSRKRKLSEEEPTWFRSYRMEVQRRHEQRLTLQKQIMEQHKLLTRQLIKVLESFKK